MKYDDSQVLHILRSVRHDMLNDMQLLKANVSLNRIDRVKEILDDIVNKARNEAKLSNLHVPRLAMFLIGYNWQPQPFKLEMEVTGEEGNWEAFENELYPLMVDIFDAFGKLSDKCTNNIVTLSIHSEGKAGTISLCYSGKITQPSLLEQFFMELNQTFIIVEKYIHEEEAVITFQLTDPQR